MSLQGQAVAFTGALENLTRDQAFALVKKAGGEPHKNARKDSTYVVVGQDAGQRKLEAIEKWGLKTLSEEGFLQLVGINSVDELPGRQPKSPAKKKAAPKKASDGDEDDADEPAVGGSKPKAKKATAAKKADAGAANGKGKEKILAAHSDDGSDGGNTKGPDHFKDLSVSFTGGLSFMTRDRAFELTTEVGAIVHKVPREDTDWVVVGTKPGKDKTDKIAQWGLKTTDEEGFFELLGVDKSDIPDRVRKTAAKEVKPDGWKDPKAALEAAKKSTKQSTSKEQEDTTMDEDEPAATADAAADDKVDDEEQAAPVAPAPKKRGRPAKNAAKIEVAVPTGKRKRAPEPKKADAEADEEENGGEKEEQEDQAPPAKKKRGRPPKAKPAADAAPKAGSSKDLAAAATEGEEAQEDAGEEQEELAAKKKAGGSKKTAEDEGEVEADGEAPVKRGRGRPKGSGKKKQ